jgi:hypothetical protein
MLVCSYVSAAGGQFLAAVTAGYKSKSGVEVDTVWIVQQCLVIIRGAASNQGLFYMYLGSRRASGFVL